MKPPTQIELIELENWVANLPYELRGQYRGAIVPWISLDEARERISKLIALARTQQPPIPPMPPRRALTPVTPQKARSAKQKRKGIIYLTTLPPKTKEFYE